MRLGDFLPSWLAQMPSRSCRGLMRALGLGVVVAALALAHAAPARAGAPYGYAFAYFTGEGFADGEQVHFALSNGDDPLDWSELAGGAPVLTSTLGERGVRDPFLIRSPDGSRFYLIATDLKIFGNGDWDRAQRFGSRSIMVWESTDLVNWSAQRSVVVSPPEAGNTWAPEAFWDPASHAYVVFWASALYSNPEHSGSSYQRILYATTRDFRTFTPARSYLDPGHAVIDTTMIEHAGRIYRFTKDERANGPDAPNGKFVFEDVGESVFDPAFRRVVEGIGKGTISRGEGPTVFKSNTEDKWYLFIDEFGGRGYVPFETTDLDSGAWMPSSGYQLPARPRHGTVLPLTGLEHARLGLTAPRICTRTIAGRVRGRLDASSGVTCLDHADVAGSVTVSGGASLVVDGGRIAGGLVASHAGVVSVSGATLRGAVAVDATTAWARISRSDVAGLVSVSRSAGPVAAELTGTTIRGALVCFGNAVRPLLEDTTVKGARLGQC